MSQGSRAGGGLEEERSHRRQIPAGQDVWPDLGHVTLLEAEVPLSGLDEAPELPGASELRALRQSAVSRAPSRPVVAQPPARPGGQLAASRPLPAPNLDDLNAFFEAFEPAPTPAAPPGRGPDSSALRAVAPSAFDPESTSSDSELEVSSFASLESITAALLADAQGEALPVLKWDLEQRPVPTRMPSADASSFGLFAQKGALVFELPALPEPSGYGTVPGFGVEPEFATQPGFSVEPEFTTQPGFSVEPGLSDSTGDPAHTRTALWAESLEHPYVVELAQPAEGRPVQKPVPGSEIDPDALEPAVPQNLPKDLSGWQSPFDDPAQLEAYKDDFEQEAGFGGAEAALSTALPAPVLEPALESVAAHTPGLESFAALEARSLSFEAPLSRRAVENPAPGRDTTVGRGAGAREGDAASEGVPGMDGAGELPGAQQGQSSASSQAQARATVLNGASAALVEALGLQGGVPITIEFPRERAGQGAGGSSGAGVSAPGVAPTALPLQTTGVPGPAAASLTSMLPPTFPALDLPALPPLPGFGADAGPDFAGGSGGSTDSDTASMPAAGFGMPPPPPFASGPVLEQGRAASATSAGPSGLPRELLLGLVAGDPSGGPVGGSGFDPTQQGFPQLESLADWGGGSEPGPSGLEQESSDGESGGISWDAPAAPEPAPAVEAASPEPGGKSLSRFALQQMAKAAAKQSREGGALQLGGRRPPFRLTPYQWAQVRAGLHWAVLVLVLVGCGIIGYFAMQPASALRVVAGDVYSRVEEEVASARGQDPAPAPVAADPAPVPSVSPVTLEHAPAAEQADAVEKVIPRPPSTPDVSVAGAARIKKQLEQHIAEGTSMFDNADYEAASRSFEAARELAADARDYDTLQWIRRQLANTYQLRGELIMRDTLVTRDDCRVAEDLFLRARSLGMSGKRSRFNLMGAQRCTNKRPPGQ